MLHCLPSMSYELCKGMLLPCVLCQYVYTRPARLSYIKSTSYSTHLVYVISSRKDVVIETKGMGVLPTLKDACHTPTMIANAMIIGQAVGWMAAEKGGEKEGGSMGGGEGLDRCQRDVISPPVNLAGLEAGGLPGIVIDPWVATVREDETATGAGTTEADHFRGPQTKEIREIAIYATALLELCAAR